MKRCLILLFTVLLACGPNGDGNNHNHDDDHNHNSEDHETPVDDACEHAEEGPTLTATAAAVGEEGPDISDSHTRYDLSLPGDDAPEGDFSFELAAETEAHFFYFDAPIDVTVTDASGTVVEPEETLSDVSACPTLVGGDVFDLGVGTYTLTMASESSDVAFVWIPGDDAGHE